MTHKRRNQAARAAIMRKGGAHEKTNKAKRQKEKQAFKKKIRAGCEYKYFGSFLLGNAVIELNPYQC